MVWLSDGSSTLMGWKRRARAASFSRCLRYSSRVVAPTVCSSPRASRGLRIDAASMAPSAAPGADQGVQLVDEQDDVAPGADLLEHLLEALLEIAPVAGPGHQGAQVQGVELLALDGLGHVAGDDLLGQPFDDGGLADAGLADENRIVFGAPGEDLHDPLDLAFAADDRVQLAFAGQLGQVAAELVENRGAAGGFLGACRAGAGRGAFLATRRLARQELDHLLAHPG